MPPRGKPAGVCRSWAGQGRVDAALGVGPSRHFEGSRQEAGRGRPGERGVRWRPCETQVTWGRGVGQFLCKTWRSCAGASKTCTSSSATTTGRPSGTRWRATCTSSSRRALRPPRRSRGDVPAPDPHPRPIPFAPPSHPPTPPPPAALDSGRSPRDRRGNTQGQPGCRRWCEPGPLEPPLPWPARMCNAHWRCR
jgi:hypothetical protein